MVTNVVSHTAVNLRPDRVEEEFTVVSCVVVVMAMTGEVMDGAECAEHTEVVTRMEMLIIGELLPLRML